MSIRISRLVWKYFDAGGIFLLIMLALADYADDHGGSIYPSIATLAAKVRRSKSQTQRALHTLIGRGIVDVVGNHDGGKPGTTRHYRINLDRLTGSTDATPTGSTHATPDGSHTCGETGSASATQSVKEHPLGVPAHANTGKPTPRPDRKKSTSPCPDPFEVNDQMAEWAIATGVPDDQVLLETETFQDHFRGHQKKDWSAAWRNWMRRSVKFAKRDRERHTRP